MPDDVRENKSGKNNRANQRGAALAIAIITVAILAVVALTALAFSSTEARIAGSDLRRTQTFYAAAAGMEKMTNDFSALFQKKLNPTTGDLNTIAASPPPLAAEGFSFSQTLTEDTARLTEMRSTQGLPPTVYPRINIPDGPFAGLYASIIPYKMSSTATMNVSKTEVELEREFNNYLVPLFQFGIFSNEDIEIHPGPQFTFNGRIHSNGNIYALRNTKFLNKMTMAGELVRSATRGGEVNNASGSNNVIFEVNGKQVASTTGSVQAGDGTVGGPNFPRSSAGQRGYFPGSPNGVANPNWETESVKPANGAANRFGGNVLTRTTSAAELKLPLELGGYSAAEIIKRSLPSDNDIIKSSRYHGKSQIRILIDNWDAGSGSANVAGIPAGQGVTLKNDVPGNTSGFSPIPLGDGNVLRRVDDASKTYVTGDKLVQQYLAPKSANKTQTAKTVRGIKNTAATVNGNYIPPGAGIQARILIEIVKDGKALDVTKEILSMGMTEGEPNGIVYLQRPLWTAFVQGSRDRNGNGFDLVSLTNNPSVAADGEITADPSAYLDTTRNLLSGLPGNIDDDGGTPRRDDVPAIYNTVVPINVYNVREGWTRSSLSEKNIYYERGMTSVVELNMKNLARWLDGIYDGNLLANTNAVSKNIRDDEGYVVYVSDRRGDRVKAEYLPDGSSYAGTNGIVDNEDIYGPNGILDSGEDVIDFGWDSGKSAASKKGTLQKDIKELPDVGKCYTVSSGGSSCESVPDLTGIDRLNVGIKAMSYQNPDNFFRRAVRLFNGEKLTTGTTAGKLSDIKGISVASENMVYIWGNYNTTGITLPSGAYKGDQIPASIVADAFFPLSKTWFDGLSAMYPEGSATPRTFNGDDYRMADDNLAGDSDGTSVRAGIIAGTTISNLTALPGRDADGMRRNGGIINYPRFLEIWNIQVGKNTPWVERAWNYTGSFVPLFRSTQALSQWENDTSIIYMPPRRNWSFDESFLSPAKLPPGTPFFQYVQATGFRQKLR